MKVIQVTKSRKREELLSVIESLLGKEIVCYLAKDDRDNYVVLRDTDESDWQKLGDRENHRNYGNFFKDLKDFKVEKKYTNIKELDADNNTNVLKCPYCLKEIHDIDIENELELWRNQRNFPVCPHCGKRFMATLHIKKEYIVAKLEEQDGNR